MTDKLWCQMCGKTVGDEIFPRLSTCQWCGAVLVEAPVKVTPLERAKALTEKLVEVGDVAMALLEIRKYSKHDHEIVEQWDALVTEWEKNK